MTRQLSLPLVLVEGFLSSTSQFFWGKFEDHLNRGSVRRRIIFARYATRLQQFLSSKALDVALALSVRFMIEHASFTMLSKADQVCLPIKLSRAFL